MTLLVNILLGVPLLILGRKLFWLFVGAVGFIAGFWIAQRYIPFQPDWIQLLVGLSLGIVGVLLALVIQKSTLIVTGFLAGAYLAMSLLENMNADLGPWNPFIYLVGGMIGTLLILSVFDWALIILSSLIGSALISQTSFQTFQFEPVPRTIIFLTLVVIGLIIQGEQKQRED